MSNIWQYIDEQDVISKVFGQEFTKEAVKNAVGLLFAAVSQHPPFIQG
jgi:hypothetical protein